MNIAICDDEAVFRGFLVDLVNNYASEHGCDMVVSEFNNGLELLSSESSFDIILIDYFMNDSNGIDTVKKLRQEKNSAIVIFISSYPEIVFESIKYKTFRFLTKPVENDKFYEAISAAISELNSKQHKIVVRDIEYDKSSVISENDIIYIQADNVYSLVATKDKFFRYPHSISALEKKIQSSFFYRCHRSYIVNFNYISAFDKKEIILSNGEKAELSRLKYKDFQSRYFLYLKEER